MKLNAVHQFYIPTPAVQTTESQSNWKFQFHFWDTLRIHFFASRYFENLLGSFLLSMLSMWVMNITIKFISEYDFDIHNIWGRPTYNNWWQYKDF